MRRHAKASTAGSTQRQAGRLGRFFRGAFATRGASDADGTGASSSRRRALLSLAVLTAAALIVAASASASKQVLTYFGSSGNLGGQLNSARDIAANSSGAGGVPAGTAYVADEGNNRIERFDPAGNFVSAWGANATHRDEAQDIEVVASGGTFTLSFEGETTAAIAYNASAGAVQTALRNLSTIGSPNVTVGKSYLTEERYRVTFVGPFEGTDVEQLTADAGGLTGAAPAVNVTTREDGSGGGGTDYEVCTVASACGRAAASGGNGTAAGDGTLNAPQSVAVDEDTGNVYVSDRGNRRIDEYEGDGTFVRSFGWNVIQTDEVQAVTVAATSGNFTLSFEGEATTELESTAEASEVETALNALASVNGGGGSVSVAGGPGDETGSEPYVVTFDGGPLAHTNVAQLTATSVSLAGGSPSSEVTVATTTPGGGVNEYGVCEAADVCKAGAGGSGAGQYGTGSTARTFAIAVSPADGEASVGTVFLADTGNRRVDTYELDGTSPSSFGSSANFGSTQPRQVAVDSRGIVYASDSNGGGVVQRYDTENADGEGVGFLAPIVPPGSERQTVHLNGFSMTTPRERFILSCPNGETTGEIPWVGNPQTAKNIASSLDRDCTGSTTYTPTNFETTGSTPNITVIFKGIYLGEDVPQMTCAPAENSVGTCSVTTEVDGVPGPLLTGEAATATAGLAVDPSNDALDVLRDPTEGNTVIEQFGPSNEPGLAAAPLEADETHGSSAGFTYTNGFGLDGSTGRLFVSFSREGINQIYVLNDLDSIPAPGLTVDPVTEIGETKATFSGTVDPMGGLVSCQFEYSTDKTLWSEVPVPGCASLETAGGPQAVGAEVTGLDPNTRYYVRLSASRPFFANSTTTVAGLSSFETTAAPPVIADVGAVQVSDTSARLVATVDPRHSPTGYIFQYGATPALGSATPPLDIGGGTEPVTVSQPVAGFSPDTTYYFRVVATSQIGTTTSPGHTLHTRTEPLPLPANRAYEMVTPPDKNFGSADAGEGLFQGTVSPTGEGVAYCPEDLFGEPPTRMVNICGPHFSKRTAGGWQDPAFPMPNFCHVEPESGSPLGGLMPYPSRDFSHLVIGVAESAGCPIPPLDPAAPLLPGTGAFSYNLYLQDASTEPAAYHLLNPAGSLLNGEQYWYAQHYAGGTEDFSHVVYESLGNQTADAPASGAGVYYKLYDRVEDGQGSCTQPGGCLNLVSKDPSGAAFEDPGLIPVVVNGAVITPISSAVSRDGERIYFNVSHNRFGGGYQCEDAGCELYMREAATTTYDVSESECTVECGSPQSTADDMISATPSGEKAFFKSCAKLTDESSPQGCSKLYRWDRGAPAGHRLVDLTADHEPNDGAQPGFLGMVGSSDDGNTAYFVTRGQIVAGEPTTPATSESGPYGKTVVNNAKLYRWEWNGGNPSVDYIGPYRSAIATRHTTHPQLNIDGWVTQVSGDGRYLMLYTTLRLDPAADHDENVDVYRWDEKDGWECASCAPPGTPSIGGVETALIGPLWETGFFQDYGYVGPRVYMSADGQRIFFATPNALVPQDVNGESGCPVEEFEGVPFYACQDVYEWHNGTAGLVSSGTGSEPARLIGAGSSGRDVFFYDRQRLVGWDVDNGTDIYDARIGGGFPEPAPQPAACEGEACRGEGTSAPSVTGAGSAAFEAAPQSSPGASSRCTALGRRTLRLSHGAKRLRHGARVLLRRAHRTRNARQARRLRLRAHRRAVAARGRAKLAHRLAQRTKRCRRAERRAQR